jgi:hypothetical protein
MVTGRAAGMGDEQAQADWRWKVPDPQANARLQMLYEPGNWGDVLKGLWAIGAARGVVTAGKLTRLHYLDPFAGAPTYPATPAAVQRLIHLTGTRLAIFQSPFVRHGAWASTAVLVQLACQAFGAQAKLAVFDLDENFRAAWKEHAGTRVLAASSAEEAFEKGLAEDPPPDLVLLDPYDFMARWKAWLPRVALAARRTTVLVYVYNRAPRSAGFWNQYRRFRGQLEDVPDLGFLVGRAPSDPVLPRAFHEMYLFGPARVLAKVSDELAQATRALARNLAEAGAFEEQRPASR